MSFDSAICYVLRGEWAYRKSRPGWLLEREWGHIQTRVNVRVEESDSDEEFTTAPELWLTKEDIDATDWEIIGG